MTAAPKGPRHVAIIMDGNGRWAEARGLPRTLGHKSGVEAVRRAVRAAADFGIEYLTIYSFSTENWSRPATEVGFLLDLLRRFILQDVAELHKSGVCIKIIGDREALSGDLRTLIEDAERLTANNSALTLVVAFNYGSKQEIAKAVQAIAHEVQSGALAPDSICAGTISKHLETASMPDPDLLIRTSGEQRISNFLLWQCAYAELVFVEDLWPDFTRETFERALAEYAKRDRRYGGLKRKSA